MITRRFRTLVAGLAVAGFAAAPGVTSAQNDDGWFDDGSDQWYDPADWFNDDQRTGNERAGDYQDRNQSWDYTDDNDQQARRNQQRFGQQQYGQQSRGQQQQQYGQQDVYGYGDDQRYDEPWQQGNNRQSWQRQQGQSNGQYGQQSWQQDQQYGQQDRFRQQRQPQPFGRQNYGQQGWRQSQQRQQFGQQAGGQQMTFEADAEQILRQAGVDEQQLQQLRQQNFDRQQVERAIRQALQDEQNRQQFAQHLASQVQQASQEQSYQTFGYAGQQDMQRQQRFNQQRQFDQQRRWQQGQRGQQQFQQSQQGQRGQQIRLSGQILRTGRATLTQSGQEHRVAQLRTNQGQTMLIDLGPADQLDQDVRSGQQISVIGQSAQRSGQQIVLVSDFAVRDGGQTESEHVERQGRQQQIQYQDIQMDRQ